MRRCPQCQSPNPSQAAFCSACGQPLPPLPREAPLRWDDLWCWPALKRAVPGLLALLAFRAQFGRMLFAGYERLEHRFLLFHLGTGLLLGLGLAWARGARRPGDWTPWVLAGVAGGLLAEGLEVWYTYRHLMGTLTFYAWHWLQLPPSQALVYQFLQGLRAFGLALPFLVLYWGLEKRFSRQLLGLVFLAMAVALRVPVRGFYLDWKGFLSPDALAHWGLYAGSMLALLYGLGLRGLTSRPVDR